MGFFFPSGGTVKEKRQSGMPSSDMLHRLECRVCPLNEKELMSPKMAPRGSEEPIIYIMGENPTTKNDEDGKQFSGKAERMLERMLPDDWEDYIRWNNVIRCVPKADRPAYIEIEACRPSIERDIARTKPIAIIGLGAAPLNWAIGESGIAKWRGRRIPIKVAGHKCWFFPMYHPGWIIDGQRKNNDSIASHDVLGCGSEFERMLYLDLKRALYAIQNDLPEPVIHTADSIHDGLEIVTGAAAGDFNKLTDFLHWAVTQRTNGVDYETNRLRPYNKVAKILSGAVAASGKCIAFPFDHRQSKWSERHRRDLDALWKWYCVQPKVIRYAHNLPFEMEWTAVKFGIDVIHDGIWEDSICQAAILDNRVGDSKPGCFSLDFKVLEHFGLGLKSLSPVNRKRLDEEPLEDVLRYNGPDAKYHDLLGNYQAPMLVAEGLEHVYRSHMRRIKAFVLTQVKGTGVDQDMVAELDKLYTGQLEAVVKRIAKMPCVKKFKEEYAREFNPASPRDVFPMFKTVLGFDIEDDKGKESTDEKVLEKIDHPLAPAILTMRGVSKLKSSYNEPLKVGGPYIYDDGRTHQILNSYFVATGRSSAEDPALQTYPKRDGEQKIVRKQIVPAKGKLFVPIDYGQIQFRAIGFESKDKTLLKALWERYDVHTEWTARIAHVYPRWLDPHTDKKAQEFKAKRNDVKNQWTFPLCFGATLQSVSGYMKIPEDKLAPLYDEFWETFSAVRAWQERIVKFYKENGYVTGVTGRRRVGPLSSNELINAPIQADEAEIVLTAMANITDLRDFEIQPALEVHDDLTFELEESKLDKYLEIVIPEMLRVNFDWITAPLVVEVSIGKNWYESEVIGEFSSDEVWDHKRPDWL